MNDIDKIRDLLAPLDDVTPVARRQRDNLLSHRALQSRVVALRVLASALVACVALVGALELWPSHSSVNGGLDRYAKPGAAAVSLPARSKLVARFDDGRRVYAVRDRRGRTCAVVLGFGLACPADENGMTRGTVRTNRGALLVFGTSPGARTVRVRMPRSSKRVAVVAGAWAVEVDRPVTKVTAVFADGTAVEVR